jgi:LPS export ABC transporter protein LptC
MRLLRRFAVLIFCAGLMFLAPACEEKIKPSVLPGIDPNALPQQESWNSTVVLSDSGRVQARIRAGYIQKFDAPQETKMSQGIVVYFYNDKGIQTTTLTAKEGKVNEQTYDLEARGDVLVVSDDSTPDFVSVTSPREKVQGQGFESDQRLRNYRIFKVTAQVRTD